MRSPGFEGLRRWDDEVITAPKAEKHRVWAESRLRLRSKTSRISSVRQSFAEHQGPNYIRPLVKMSEAKF